MDGSISTSADSATTFQSTAEALVTFARVGVTGDVVNNALAYVHGFPSDGSTELLSRRIVVDSLYGLDTSADVANLVALQNGDGGFGTASGFESTPLDTAFALEALFAARNTAGDESARAIGYLIAQQHPTGGWALGVNEDDLHITARALKSLWYFRHAYAVGTNLELAKNFLLSRRGSDGQWHSADLSAQAFDGILPLLPDLTPAADGIRALQSAQLGDLSWANDVYATALALRIISSSRIETNPDDPGSIVTNPDLGSITGRVALADSGLGLGGVAVSLAGPVPGAVLTQADGTFFFNKLPAGSYLVALSPDGYGSFASPVVVGYGSNVDLGNIQLNAVVTPTTATVRGLVTRASDGVALSSVTVTANGKSATTDAAGRYEIAGIAPGVVTLKASRYGYLSVSAVADAVAGGVIVFSPQLSTSNTGIIKGTVRNASTGQTMAGVTITLSGATTKTVTTGSTGSFSITGFNAGPTTIKASATGYSPVSADIVADIGGSYDFSPNLTPVAEATTSLQVVVTSAATKTPIAGAGVELSGANNTMSQTDFAGRIEFTNLAAGTTTIKVQNGGFEPESLTVVIVDGTSALVPVALIPEGLTTPSSAVTGRIVEAGSGTGVPGVVIEAIQDDTVITALADSEGRFELSKVTAGAWKLNVGRSNFVAFGTEFFMPAGLPSIALGDIVMHPVARLPDLVPFSVDRSGLASNKDTFVTEGTMGITLRNQGQAVTQTGFNLLVYFDADLDDEYDPAVDRFVATKRVTDLIPPDTNLTTLVDVQAELPYRDALLTIRLDNLGEIPEGIEENNQGTTAELAGCGQ